METYRYSLDNSRPTKLFICPWCGKKKLKRYVDTFSKEYLHADVGKCERIDNCTYHYTPKQYFKEYGIKNEYKPFVLPKPTPIKPISYIAQDLVEKSMTHPNNCFVEYLKALFGNSKAEELRLKFNIGTSRYWQGASVFWQIDNNDRIRSGKVMLYNPKIGKRIKEPFNHIQWVHSILKISDFNLAQCLFGLHQLTIENNQKPIAIVESEKTVVLMTVIDPKFLWMASGGKNLNIELFKPIKGRKITLFPDLNCFEAWEVKATEIRKLGGSIHVSEILETVATEKDREDGLDIADYLIKRDESGLAMSDNGYPLIWDR
jgi:hypothetical protein